MNFNNFVGVYPLSKTIRNRLIPDERTQAFIDKEGILSEDEERAAHREICKEVMDDYYRYMLQSVLADVDYDWSGLFTAKRSFLQKEISKDQLEQWEAQARGVIAKAFADWKDYNKSFSAKLITDVLPAYIDENEQYSEAEKEDKKRSLSLFSHFTTSFKDFFTNRENVFSKEAIHTSAAYRIVNENASIFADNLCRIQRIETDMPGALSLAAEGNEKILCGRRLEQIFQEDFFRTVLGQRGIEYYNDICGIVNSRVNECCQQNKLKRRKYKLRRLHKQILSKTESRFEVIRPFENDQEVYQAFNACVEKIVASGMEAQLREIVEMADEYDDAKIFVTSNEYSFFSQILYKDWELVSAGQRRYYEETIKKKNKAEEIENKIAQEEYRSLASLRQLALMCMPQESELRAATSGIYIRKRFESVLTSWIEAQIGTLSHNSEQRLMEDEESIAAMKASLDVLMRIRRTTEAFMVDAPDERDSLFYSVIHEMHDAVDGIVPLYNKVRNYVTQKPYTKEKIKLNFKTPQLASGWSVTKEYDYNSILLFRNESYYLGVFNAKNKPDRHIIEGSPSQGKESDYKKMEYYFLPGPNKMLPKVFFSKKGIKEYAPSAALLEGYKQGRHIKSNKNFDLAFCHELIDFFKTSMKAHPEWSRFGFKFSETAQYADISRFYKEVADQGYRIQYVYLSEESIDQMVGAGQLYLFQIYNKDFAPGRTGRDNLHTMYFKNMFSEENLRDIVLKLNGEAELFYRKASIRKPIVHKAGSTLVNKTIRVPDAGCEERIRKSIPETVYQELYAYLNGKKEDLSNEARRYLPLCESKPAKQDLIRDRRYTMNQYAFHCPITINFKASTAVNINEAVLREIAGSEDINIIGIDRGERNLLYVSVIDVKGNIIEQKSFNLINNYDYKGKLEEREKERTAARKNWAAIDKIKDLKEGYISQVIHEICEMVVRYRAIIIMEDLNYGFKRGRFKVERQVYQKFETMLLSKLCYVVDKKKGIHEPGGLLKGYQLAYMPKSLELVGRQCGIVFYVPAGYTSKIDPTTGFVDVFNFKNYANNARRKQFLLQFDAIRYDAERKLFAFTFDYNKFDTYQSAMARNIWTAHTYGERICHVRNNGYWTNEVCNPTERMRELVRSWKYEDGHDLRADIACLDVAADKDIIRGLFECFQRTVQMRNSKSGDDSYDRIISPIANAEGIFFDSSQGLPGLPIDADANGAFHIALKGLCIVRQVHKHWQAKNKCDNKLLRISNEQWFKFVQDDRHGDSHG